ncbi:MAG TPA: hypothetical protein VFE62_28825 [Gemmataceae bacterium]|nr:hypothetical protein [Gemmataceae bacterium]
MNQTLEFSRHEEMDRLAAEVRKHLNGRLWGFQLLVHSQGLVLRGETHSFHAKQLAQHLVMKVTEVPILANEIVVTCSYEI